MITKKRSSTLILKKGLKTSISASDYQTLCLKIKGFNDNRQKSRLQKIAPQKSVHVEKLTDSLQNGNQKPQYVVLPNAVVLKLYLRKPNLNKSGSAGIYDPKSAILDFKQNRTVALLGRCPLCPAKSTLYQVRKRVKELALIHIVRHCHGHRAHRRSEDLSLSGDQIFKTAFFAIFYFKQR